MQWRSEPDAGLPEGVARPELSVLHPGLEPRDALSAGAVGEALRRHVAARLLLERVVADRRSSGEARLDVARLDESPLVARLVVGVGVGRPDTGVAVRLELGEDAERIGVLTADGPSQLHHPPLGAE